jgi:exonuclease III
VNVPRACLLTLLLCAPVSAEPVEKTRVAFDWNFDLGSLFRFGKNKARSQDDPGGAPAGPPSFRIVSWNMQTFGSHIKERRRLAAAEAIAKIFSDPANKILAAQEIANKEGASTLSEMLSADREDWRQSFKDTRDSQDNGFWTRGGVRVDCERPLFSDPALSVHPAHFAHMRVGDFDFTLITLHLTYQKGNAESSVAELRHVLDWLREYLPKRGADPDVVITGDFNLPTRKGKGESARGGSGAWTALEDVIDEYPMFRGEGVAALVDEPTSRSHGETANNYDHFLITRHLRSGAYIEGSARRRPADILEAIERLHSVQVSDHLPIAAEFRSGGAGADGLPIRPDGDGACGL